MSVDSQYSESFGNYDQDIVVSINYAPLDTEKTLNNNNKMTAKIKAAVILLLFCYYFICTTTFYEDSAKHL